MKKEYTKPNMEIVSFNLEENITDGTSAALNTKNSALQTTIRTINY